MDLSKENVIHRSSPPTKLDTSDYKTVCIVNYFPDILFYVQLSHDSENPRWEKVDEEQLKTIDK